MPKRYIMKVEVEFECPATVAPNEAFYRYWSANRKVENDKIKVLESKIITTPSKVNDRARAHNECRRILQVVLEQSLMPIKISNGYRTRWDNGRSNFKVVVNPPGGSVSTHWIAVKGSEIVMADSTFNLADPTAITKLIAKMKCNWGLCSHKPYEKHS